MGLTRSQWCDVRADERREAAADIRNTPAAVVKIQGCRCRSVWCRKCAAVSPSNDAIRARLEVLAWRDVRHVILTVGRSRDPGTEFAEVRESRAIARVMSVLGVDRWIWVLEFHAGGWPHWHVIADTGGRMLGHAKIKESWGRGHVWESPIRSEAHWGAIVGYHRKKGYLAGESKAHQLELPEYLMAESRVRKFGASFALSCPWPKKANLERGPRRARARSYRAMLGGCDTETKILVGSRVATVPVGLSELRAAVRAGAIADLGGGRYVLDQGTLSDVLRLR